MLPQKFLLIIPRKNSLMHKSNLIFFYIKFFSTARYYKKKTKESYKKSLKGIKIFLKKKKKKSVSMIANDIKIFLKIKTKVG